MKKTEYYPVRKVSSIKEMIAGSAMRNPAKDIFRIRTSKTTYKSVSWYDFQKDINSLGSALIDEGLQDSNICVIGENSYEWVLTYMTVINGVGVIVPIDKDLLKDEIKNIISFSDAKAVFFSKTYEAVITSLLSELPNISLFVCIDSVFDGYKNLGQLIEKGSELIADGDDKYCVSTSVPEKPATIIFTSGTTGISKGVVLSHSNLLSNITAAASMIRCTKSDVVISILPLHHAYEMTCNILAVFLCEAVICFGGSLKHLNIDFVLFKPTLLFLVPVFAETFYKRIKSTAEKKGQLSRLNLAVKISRLLSAMSINIKKLLFADIHEVFGGRLKKIVIGGAPAKADVVEAFCDFGILMLQGYGISECSPLVSVNREKEHKHDSVGLPVPCCEVRVKEGEIQVKGTNVMLGYYKNEQETKAAFDGEWFKTGDLGYIDKDGFLYITGRKKNLIILSNGKNVYPEEIEQYLMKIEQIIEVVVYGQNDKITAEIFPDYSIDDVENIINEQIGSINKTLPVFKHIQSVKFRQTEFVKTTTKKIKRHLVGGQ